jgi:hypothetical protein
MSSLFNGTITVEEREKLYNEIWSEPVTVVAKRYGISDVGLRKHCIRYGIPLPYRGYWARVKNGQKLSKTPLPPVTGSLKNEIRNYLIKYKKPIKQMTDQELKNEEELSLLTEETKIFIRDACSKIQVPSQLRNPHYLITEHKEESFYRKNPEKREKNHSKTNYSVRINGRYTVINAMLPIFVSPSNINRAYRILNTIINALEDMESYANVGYEFDSNKDTGSFQVMHTTFRFELTEEMRKKRKNDDEHPTHLVLSLVPETWFGRRTGNKIEYKDQSAVPLESQLGKIIYDMFVVANQFRCLNSLDEREYERQKEEKERQRRLEEIRNGELAEVKLLEQAASDWDKAEKIRRFTDAMERKIAEVDGAGKKETLLKWLRWARDKADWLDPLTAKEDELLGKAVTYFKA